MKGLKFISLAFSFFYFLFFFKVSIVRAEVASDYIDKVEVTVTGGDSAGSILIPKQFSSKSVIYKDARESYLSSGSSGNGANPNYTKIGVSEANVSLGTVVTFNEQKLKTIGGWTDVKRIWVHKGCSGTGYGDQYVPSRNGYLEIADFVNAGYKVEFPAEPKCKVDLLFAGRNIDVEFWLQKDGGSWFPIKLAENIKFSWSAYSFEIVDKPLNDTCDIKIYNSSSKELISSADNETPIKIVGTDIDDGGKGHSLLIGTEVIKSYGGEQCVFTEGDNFDCQGVDEPSFEYDLGKKSEGNYTIFVNQNGTNGVLCQMQLPVGKVGATPTPFSAVTGIQGNNSNLTISLATTIPLCDSIPNDVDCGNGEQCRTKCMQCEKNNEIWTGIGCMPTDFSKLIYSLFTTFAGILGALIFFCVASNGLKIMVSQGNAEAMKKAQQAITACIVGFLVLATSVLFLKIVGVNILQLPGWS